MNVVGQELPNGDWDTVSDTEGRPQRRGLHAYVSDESHAGWQEFAANNFVTVAAVIEAVGIWLAECADLPPEQQDERIQAVIAEARQLDRERRSRRRT